MDSKIETSSDTLSLNSLSLNSLSLDSSSNGNNGNNSNKDINDTKGLENKELENKEITFKIGTETLSISFKELMNSYAKTQIKVGKEDLNVCSFSQHFSSFIDFSIFEIELDQKFYPLEFMNMYFDLIKEKDKVVLNTDKEIVSISDKMYSIFSSVMDSTEKRQKFALFLERVGDEYICLLFAYFNAQLIMNNDERILNLRNILMENADDTDDDEKS